MAKGGISLNPGADPTLVRAATYAAMANVPKDLSGTFEAMATNYAATMKIVGETWAGVAKIGGELAGEAISIYAQNKKYDAMGIGIQNKDGTSFLYDQLQKTRQGLKDTWFNPVTTDADGNPLENWRDLNRAKRLEFRQDKAKLEAQIVDLNNGYNNLATRLETGDYHQAATGNGNWRMINAVGAYKSSSGKTKDGDYVLPDMDENGDVFFTLYGSDGKEVKSKDGENVTVKAGEIEGLLTPKNDTVISNANKLFLNLEASGKIKGRNYGMDGKVFRKNFGKLLEDEGNMHILMNEDLYMLGRTFNNDVSNADLEGGSITSANIYRLSSQFVDSKGKPLKFEDVDGGGISESDFKGEKGADNYNKVASAILDKTNKFYNKDVTKTVFEDWAHTNGEAAFKYGAGMRTGTDTDTSDSGAPNFYSKGKKIERKGNKGYMSGGTATGIYNKIQAGLPFDAQDPITGETNNYSYHDGGWYQNWQEGDTPETKESYVGPNGGDVGSIFTEDPRWQNIETNVEEEVDEFGEVIVKAKKTPGTFSTVNPNIDINIMKKDDDDVASYIQTLMPAINTTANPNNYQWSSARPSGRLTGGEGFLEVISLYDKEGNIVRYPEGHSKAGKKIRIKVGGNQERREQALKDLDDVLKTFGLAKHVGGGGTGTGTGSKYNTGT